MSAHVSATLGVSHPGLGWNPQAITGPGRSVAPDRALEKGPAQQPAFTVQWAYQRELGRAPAVTTSAPPDARTHT